MIAFVDFEASSLAKDSYPIEVAWVFENETSESWLIRPAPGWTDWDEAAAAIHGRSRAELMAAGVAHEVVAARMVAVLAPHRLYASAPSWDGKWLSVLLRAAGLPRRALRLADTLDVRMEIAAEILVPRFGAEQAGRLAREMAEQVVLDFPQPDPPHRALADARRELVLYGEVRRRAMRLAAG